MNTFDYLNATVNLMTDLVYAVTDKYVIRFTNSHAKREMGTDITGQVCYTALYNRDNVCPWCKWNREASGEPGQWEFRQPGTNRWYRCVCSPVIDLKTVSMLIIRSDITNSKQFMREKRESRRQLQTLMDNLPGMVYRCRADEEFSMMFASNRSHDLLGYRPDELVREGSSPYKDLVDPRDRQDLIHAVVSALEKKRSFSCIYRIRRASGETIWVWEQGEGVFSATGEPIAIEGFVTDFTRQKEAEIDLRKMKHRLKSLSNNRYRFRNIIGKSEEMNEIYELIEKAATSDENVVIFGESGTGKELVAQSIHELSDRKDESFVSVNCGAISIDLMESEFFGHVQHAFTDAKTPKTGYFGRADRGTLFLDEMGVMKISMQIALLRAIETKEYIPVGASRPRKSDFRMIAATNMDLVKAVHDGSMRDDFFYRINVLPIHLPPLRERREDIPLLIDHIIEKHPSDVAGSKRIPARVREIFEEYDWPGNVRELQNAIHRYLAFGQISIPGADDLKGGIESLMEADLSNGVFGRLEDAMKQVEGRMIRAALERHMWHRGQAAQYLGIDRKTLYRKMKQMGLSGLKDDRKPGNGRLSPYDAVKPAGRD